jgi:hypothetical protein
MKLHILYNIATMADIKLTKNEARPLNYSPPRYVLF